MCRRPTPTIENPYTQMTRALPYTEASLARRIKGVQRAGLHVVEVKPDGTLIVADKPVDVTSIVPVKAQTSPAAEIRRMGEYFNGGPGEA
jgi:hypothetical protein